MHDDERHIDEDSEPRVCDKFSVDLKSLYEPGISVPPQVDRAVMDRAYQQLIYRRRRRRVFLRGACAAAAAVVMLVLILDFFREAGPETTRSDVIAAKDINQDGEVNVLDAFQLAKRIEAAGQLEAGWDINGDGSVNQDDVDSVAFAAVRLDKGVL